MAESLRRGRRGGRVRRNGVIEEVPLVHNRRPVDFTGGSAMTVAIPWGDLATAYVSTGIPNIETYASMPPAAVIAGRALNWARPLFARAPAQNLLRRLADRSTGPSETLRGGATPGEIPLLGRGVQCGGRASHSAAGDHQWLPPDGRRHDHGGEIPVGARTTRRLLHAEHVDGRTLRGTVARADSHPRGLEPSQGYAVTRTWRPKKCP
jgi:hypothetical protein